MYKIFPKIITIYLLLFCISSFNYISADNNTKNIYTKDFDILVKNLIDIHPNASKVFKTKEVAKIIKNIKNKMKTVNKEYEFVYLASRLISELKDGHTEILCNTFYKDLYLPFEVTILKDEIFVTAALDKYKKLMYCKITKMGKYSAKEMIKRVNKYITGDNRYNKIEKTENFIVKRTILKYLDLLDKNNAVDITFMNKNDKVFNEKLKVSDYYYFGKVYRSDICKNEITKLMLDDDYVVARYKILPKYKTAYFQINEFNDIQVFGSESQNKSYKIDLRKIYKPLFKAIKKNKIEYLVIDLRNNGGGDPHLAYQLLSYLPKEKGINLKCLKGMTKINGKFEIEANGFFNLKDHDLFYDKKYPFYMEYPSDDLIFKGKVYAIIGDRTFSMGSAFASMIQDNNYGTVLGEPTGVSSKTYGGTVSLVLPNTNIEYSISQSVFTRYTDPKIKYDALYPDNKIYMTLEDYLKKIDPVWEYLIKNVF